MSAEGLLFTIGEELLGKVISLLADEISLARDFKDELQRLEKNLKMVNSLIYDAFSNNKTQDRSVQEWLKGLDQVAYKAEAVVDEYSYETLGSKIKSRKRDKVVSIISPSKNPFLIRQRLAHAIKKVNVSLDESYKKGTMIKLVEKVATTRESNRRVDHPFIQESFIVGRDDDIRNVVDMLCGSHDSDIHVDDLPVIAIIGIGGQGKTTLVKLVCKQDKVLKHFDKIIWITVSEDFDVTRLLNEMIESLTEEKSQLTNVQAIIKKLGSTLQMKRYLLVLDDVWNQDEEKWSCFKSALLEIKAASGSRILTTTRDNRVASTMNTSRTYTLQKLSDKESWTVFKQRAFAEGGAPETAALVDIGKEIVKKCQGLPLALKVIGSLMFSKESEHEWLLVQNSQLWNFDNNTNRVIQSLKLSYDHLSFPLKRCFSFCSFYPKDKEIEKNELIERWMALGLLQPPLGSGVEMEDVGDKYYKTLLSCSLLEDARKDEMYGITICKMHDIIHDLALEMVQMDYSILNSQALVSSEVNSKLHLRVLVLDDYLMLNLPDSIKKLKHLRYLDIRKTSIDEPPKSVLPKSVTKLYNLQTLKIKRLYGVPKDFGNLINLRHLYVKSLKISGVKDSMSLKVMSRTLTTISCLVIEDCSGSELESIMGELLGNNNIRSLKELDIINCRPEIKSVPEQLQQLTALTHLRLYNLEGLESLPDWLGNLSSLKYLILERCKKLKYLPSTEAMRRLTALDELLIIACPLLESRCKERTRPEWIKISHIPNIFINLHNIRIDFHMIDRGRSIE